MTVARLRPFDLLLFAALFVMVCAAAVIPNTGEATYHEKGHCHNHNHRP